MIWSRRRALAAPELGVPWSGAEYCVLDVETTGLDLHRDDVISFGAVQVRDGRIRCDSVVYRQVHPRRPVSVAAATVHGLRDADLAEAPPIDEVLDELVGLLTGQVLVAHAAWIERAFLTRILARRGLRLHDAVVDTAALLLAAGLAPTGARCEPDLETTAMSLGLPVHTPHHALGDAVTTAEVLLAAAGRLRQQASREQGAHQLTADDLVALSAQHGYRPAPRPYYGAGAGR